MCLQLQPVEMPCLRCSTQLQTQEEEQLCASASCGRLQLEKNNKSREPNPPPRANGKCVTTEKKTASVTTDVLPVARDYAAQHAVNRISSRRDAARANGERYIGPVAGYHAAQYAQDCISSRRDAARANAHCSSGPPMCAVSKCYH